MRDLEAENRRLRDRIDELEETVRQMKAGHARLRRYNLRGIPPAMDKLLEALQENADRICTVWALAEALGGGSESGARLVRVYVSKARSILREIGVEITTVWGVGYTMTKEHSEKLNAYCRICELVE